MTDDGRRKMPKKYCPGCRSRLIDFRDTGLWRSVSIEAFDEGVNCDMVVKCEKCHMAVGITFKKDTA